MILVSIAILLCSMAMAPPSWSQTLLINSVNADSYPLMKARFSAFDAQGKEFRIFSNQGIHITEFDKQFQPTFVQCPAIIPPNALSVVLAIDVSGSMEQVLDGKTNLDFAKEAVTNFLKIVNFDISECAITSFNNESTTQQDFTFSSSKLLKALEQLQPNGGTNYTNGLLQPNSGAFEIAKKGTKKRVVIFLTDGAGELDFQKAVDSALVNNITFYAIGLRLRLREDVRKLSDTTGGQFYDEIKTQEELTAIYEKILNREQTNTAPCEVQWIANEYCDVRTIPLRLTLPDIKATATTSYTLPEEKVRKLGFSSTQINFGSKNPGIRYDTTVTMYAKNKAFTITNISSLNPLFTVTPTSATIPSNDSLIVKISITPPDTSFFGTRVAFKTDECSYDIFSTCGVANLNSTTTLKLITPNGRETFGVFSDTVIRWEGVSKEEKVLLEFSTNNGGSWKTITEEATNHEYRWTSIPPEASTQCLVRVSQRKQFPYPRDFILKRPGIFGGISWSPTSSKIAYCRNGSELSIKDVSTQEEKILTDANGYWSTAFSPDGKQVITYGGSGVIRIIDVETMSIVRQFTGDGFATDMKVSPDGQFIATINVNGLLNISQIDGTPVQSKQLPVKVVNNVNDKKIFWNQTGTAIAYSDYFPNGSDSARIYVYEYPSLQQIGYKAYVARQFYTNFFSPNGQFITTTTNTVGETWDVRSSATVKDIPYRQYHNIMSVSNNQKYVLYFFNLFSGYTPTVYNALQYTVIRTIPKHRYDNEISWSPNSKYVVTTGLDSALHFSVIEHETLQSDMSNDTFSTVYPVVTAKAIELDTVELPKYQDSVVTGFLELQTPFPITIDSIGFSYAMFKNTFSIISNSTNLRLENDKPLAVEFRFRPYFRGYIETTYSIYMGGNEIATAPIRAMAIDSIFTRLASQIDMGEVQLGSSKDSMNIRTVRNVNIRHIPIRSIRIVGSNDFTLLSSPDPFTLNRTQTLMVDIRFTPSRGGLIQAMLEIEYDGPNSPLYIPIIGVGLTDGEFLLVAEDVHTNVVSKVDVPIVLKQRNATVPVSEITASFDIEYRPTVAIAQSGLPQRINDTTSSIRIINIPLTPGVVTKIPFQTGLGDRPYTIVGLSNLEVSSPLDISTKDGSITLLGICEEGGTRLLNPTGRTGVVALTVNGGRIELELDRAEAGSAQLTLTNQIGQIVYSTTLHHTEQLRTQESIITINFSSGVYYLTFTTATTSQTVPVMLVK